MKETLYLKQIPARFPFDKKNKQNKTHGAVLTCDLCLTWIYMDLLFSCMRICPLWPFSIAGLAVAIVIAPSPVCTVQYSLLTVPTAERSSRKG